MISISKQLISYIVRGTQLVFSIICLGTGAKLVNDGWTLSYAGLNVATAVLTIIYLPILFLPLIYKFIPVMGLVVAELVLFVLWLSSFATIASAGYGSADCDISYVYSYWGYSVYDGYSGACKAGKALLAFGILNWLLFIGTLLVTIYYVAYPNKSTMLAIPSIIPGALFLSETLAKPVDEEARIESEDEPKEIEPTDMEPTVDVTDPVEQTEMSQADIEPSVDTTQPLSTTVESDIVDQPATTSPKTTK